MKSLIKLTVFIGVMVGLLKLPSLAPVKNEVVDSNIKSTIATNNDGVSSQKVVTVEQPAPIVAEPIKPAVEKTPEIHDGVWEWRDLIAKYFPKEQQQNALRIMSKENGAGDPKRVSAPNKNGSRDYGLFQLNDKAQGKRVGYDLEQFKDPETNVRIAYQIWSEQGWRPWSTAKKLGL